jgi:glycosidase
VERFCNGDTTNDPIPEDISSVTQLFPVPDHWSITPWTQDWWKQEPWALESGRPFNETLQHRRYGGDLQGVLNKLDYLQDLGITAIYFNPLNDAPSLHKYDARYYHHMDVHFGPDPEGDKKIIAEEVLEDASTWHWTSADTLFLYLVKQCHQRGIKVIVDYSWNHTGTEFWAWKDILKLQAGSKYRDWYEIESFDDPETQANEFSYRGWANVSSLPELKKVDVKGPRISGKPYEGNIHPEVKKHIFEVTRRWLAPNGDPTQGIDGFRLDVAEQIPLGFWREYRTFVKSIKPEAYLVGEVWWEKWPDKLADPAPYVNGEIFDAVMFYQIYKPARSFFVGGEYGIDARQLADSLKAQWENLPKAFRYAQMNVNATHDSPRLLTCFANKGKYKYRVNPFENPECITGKPDVDTYRRVRLYLIHQFTIPGSPSIWNGDEMGMWGADDPNNRKPLWWSEYKFEPEARYNIQPGKQERDKVEFNREHFEFYQKLIALRKKYSVLVMGDITFLPSPPKVLVYERRMGSECITVIINAGESAEEVTLRPGVRAVDLLEEAAFNGTIQVPPLTAFVLKHL